MRCLLDTHVLLWWMTKPRVLTQSLRDFLDDRSNDLVLSVAVPWELAIKTGKGKLDGQFQQEPGCKQPRDQQGCHVQDRPEEEATLSASTIAALRSVSERLLGAGDDSVAVFCTPEVVADAL